MAIGKGTQGRQDSLRRITDPLGTLRDWLATKGLEWFCKRYYGIYSGTVIDNADPEGRGRIRALCPAVNMATEDRVGDNYWMLPCMDGMGTDPETGQKNGVFFPPDVGMKVWVSFQYGDPSLPPVYMGGYITDKDQDALLSGADALARGMRTTSGHYIRMNEDPDDLHLVIGKGDGEGGPSSMFLSMSKEGSLTVTNEVGSLLYMNAEDNEVSILNGKDDGTGSIETLSMMFLGDDKITLGTKSGGALAIDGKNITITGDNVVADCSAQFAANAGTVMLGKGAAEPAVRGLRLVQWCLLHQHTIVLPVPGMQTATGPIPPPMLYNELSEKVFIA
jgi:hypothetical protein